MSLYVLDTDMLTLAERGHPDVASRIRASNPAALAITVISVEEQLTGWYAVLRRARDHASLARAYQRLAQAATWCGRWTILPHSESTIARVVALHQMRLNVGKMDLSIAAIVLEHGGVLVTRNRRDFARVPGLLIEDWSLPIA
ncbi:tRNA(fMet)-specific endonuclease VapC [Aquisphaera giovannonii]|uniref:tRNA(fMet)-specific endonuclease VapC n=1 Tax=Aquisphaera giovannonii TaxID=406548 RepID=A0A5B9VUV4_9BACT|nr:type II toxin-antitoxin system VapC family toxin [Aquisphaera giovannonii]QEH31551.1 tRNA(fMet)-specific endonuclease VapC [Aquisphaera giovannonii]